MTLRYDGRVAVITGAGRGLGRQYALFLASRGAKVVVNDIGKSPCGDGPAEDVAERVVRQIRQKGGEAVVDTNSVLEGDKIIKTAIDAYGRIDILINNAGVGLKGAFKNRTNEQWNMTLDTHLFGAFKCTKAAWSHMREKGYGRIINTTSNVGLYGSQGLVDYSTAKSGLNGFTMSLALEGGKRNIFTNSLAPIADTRMLRMLINSQEILKKLPTSAVLPIIALLSHQSCKQNGVIFESGGGWFSKVRWQRSQGVRFDPDNMTPQMVASQFKKVCSFEGKNEYPVYDPNWGNKVNEWMKKSKL